MSCFPKIPSLFYQTDVEIAKMCAAKITDEYAGKHPSAIKCLQEDFDACIQHIAFPAGHHKHIMATNLLELAFVGQKRRTKAIPRFFDEKSCLKLLYVTMVRASEKWRQAQMSDYDITFLRSLRKLYKWEESEDGFISKKTAA